MQLLRTILIILLFWYGFKILARLFGPYLVKYASKKMEKKFKQQFNQQRQQNGQDPKYKEGETVIDRKPQDSNAKKSSEEVGEYIEFEEID
ncbi:DUF4834 family protein [Galbibacter mesophilus]|uniref:DUF4834 family protein n=1 Tax=Galbibacter mesophilus TaxID=379069 RepID=UPI0019202C02|nr:DUF4834 family protein [Galbibacter mesophilus]MCM5663529.1 DUF4834 family protein [Galbibacter mesophilus]